MHRSRYSLETAAHNSDSTIASQQQRHATGVVAAEPVPVEALRALRLREALGEKLQTEDEWEMNEADWAEVDDLVQHYLIARELRRPPFWDTRPVPTPVDVAPDTVLELTRSLPVMVINLENREDRRRFIDMHMSDSEIPYE